MLYKRQTFSYHKPDIDSSFFNRDIYILLRGKMRLLFLSATVGLYMIITSHAVPEPDTSTKASSSPGPVTSTDTSSENPDSVNSGIASLAPVTSTEASSEDAEKRSLLLVKDLAREFTAKYMVKSFADIVSSFLDEKSFSPFSAFLLVSLLSYRANGRTRDKYLEIIQLSPEKSEMAKTGYRKFLEETAKNNLSIKTRIFVRSNSTLEPKFVNLSKDVFKAEIGLYGETWDNYYNGIRESINDWVKAQSNLPPLFQYLVIGPETDMIVVNIIKLERAWKTPFNVSLTQLRPFHPFFKRDPVNVPTMHISGRFRHGRLPESSTSFIELPFESKGDDDKMSMFIIRPDNSGMVEYQMKYFADLNLTRLLNSTKEQVDLYLPIFSFHRENEAFLPQTESDKRFEKDHAGEMLIRNTVANDVVSVLVNETGHFAKESTGLVDDLSDPHPLRIGRSTSEAPVKFLVDRPFIAIIATFIEESLNPLLVIKLAGREFVP